MTQLIGPDRVKKVEEKYGDYKRRQYEAVAVAVLCMVLLPTLASLILPDSPPIVKAILPGVVVIVALVGLVGAIQISDSADKLLPSVEDRPLHYLDPALRDLKSFATEWDKSSKNKCLKNLGKIADILELWTYGNLKFIQEGIGAKVEEFRKRFRQRLISTIKNAEKGKTPNHLPNASLFLERFEHMLESNHIGEPNLVAWNEMLSPLPEYPPNLGKLRKLRTKNLGFHTGWILGSVFTGTFTYFVALDVAHSTADGAVYSGIAIFGLILAPYLRILTRERLKGT